MKRPRGVTLLAYIYFLVAFSALLTVLPSKGFDPYQQHHIQARSVPICIIAVIVGVALLKLKNWSRWIAIIGSAVGLFSSFYVMATDHRSTVLIRAGASMALSTLVIWYLTRLHVKMAFHSD